jgi:predicted ATPase with chaperone activity
MPFYRDRIYPRLVDMLGAECRSSRKSSESVRARVQAARDTQRNRFSNRGLDVVCDANMRMGRYGSSASYRRTVQA